MKIPNLWVLPLDEEDVVRGALECKGGREECQKRVQGSRLERALGGLSAF